jgi:hypothetical protein
MGTRSLTFVYDEYNDPIINLYRQYDGYPSGHGVELAGFLVPFKVGNGIGGETTNFANGMGCLAAQIVANFKDGAGQFYLYSVTQTDLGQDYEYHIYKDKVVVKNYSGNAMFAGDWNAFFDFCYDEELA